MKDDDISVAYMDVHEFTDSYNSIPHGWKIWSENTFLGIDKLVPYLDEEGKPQIDEDGEMWQESIIDGPGDVVIIRALKGTPIPEGFTEIFPDTEFIDDPKDIRTLMFKGPVEYNEFDSYKHVGIYNDLLKIGLIDEESIN